MWWQVGSMNAEVKILSGLDHPNIINYYESFAHEGSLYIVMELVRTYSLTIPASQPIGHHW
jgi:serine/threonine protein kinase